MKTSRKFTALALILVVVSTLLPTMPVIANDYGQIVLGRSYSSQISAENTSDRFTIELTRAGTLTINVTRDNSQARLPDNVADVVWCKADNTEIASHTLAFPYNFSMDLPDGIYHIDIIQCPGPEGTNVGTYSFQAVHVVSSGDNNSIETAQPITIGQTERGILTTSGFRKFYIIELIRPGRLTVNATRDTLNGNATVRLLSTDGTTQIASDSIWSGSSGAIIQRDLEAGTYFISVTGSTSITGTYDLRIDFTAVWNNETEPNNSSAQAQLITSGQTVKGFLSHQDTVDFYRVELTQPGRLTVKATRDTLNGNATVRLLSADGTTHIASDSIWSGSSGAIIQRDLEAGINNYYASGIYFISIIGSTSVTGTYDLRIDFSAAGNNETEPNNDRNQAQLITLGQTVKGFLSHQDTLDFYRVVLTQPSRLIVKATRDTLTASATVRLLSADGAKLIASDSIWSGTTGASIQKDLEAGTYFISVTGSTSITGTYNLTIQDLNSLALTITATASPTNGGTVTGGGTYQPNTSVTLRATANSGFTFDGWYEGNSKTSTNANYTFTVTANRTLEARFLSAQGWTLSPTNIAFTSAILGYGAQTARSVTISNSNATALTGVSASITAGSANFEIVTSPSNSISAGGTSTVNLRPKAGLAAGSYNGVLTVTTSNGSPQTASLSFVVTADNTSEDTQPLSFDNPHSIWAREELERAFVEGLVPPLLRTPDVDLREPINRVEFAGIVVLTYENLSGERVQPATNTPFTDTSDIYARMAYNAGLMVGVSETQFAPNMILNRETAATALTRVFKRWHFTGWSFAADDSYTLNFARPAPFADDTSISGWAKDSVYFMAANRIILGVGNNTFAPRATTTTQQVEGYANATREQALLIALRMVENMK